MQITLVPKEHVYSCWPRVEPLLKLSADRTGGRFLTKDLQESLLCNISTLWIIFDSEIIASAMTRFVDYPNRRMMVIDHIGGEDVDEWGDLFFSTMDRWARDNKCDGIEGYARHGWAPILKKLGWKRPYSVFEKDLRSI